MFSSLNRKIKYEQEISTFIEKYESERENEYQEIELEKSEFPAEFIELFELAQTFGQSCDLYRTYIIYTSVNEKLSEVIDLVSKYKVQLENWLSDIVPKKDEEIALASLYTCYLDVNEHLKKLT